MNHCINCINRLGTGGVWTQREAKRSKGQVVFVCPIRSSVGDLDPQDHKGVEHTVKSGNVVTVG
jgi:hypothetical protein